MSELRRRFLNGDRVAISGLGDRHDLPDATAVDVFDIAGTEVEFNAGSDEACQWFLDETGTVLDDAVTLSDGREIKLGSMGGDASAGYAFCLAVDERRLYGNAPSNLELDRLVRSIGGADIRNDRDGLIVSAQRSKARRPNVMQMVPGEFLIDVTPARRGARRRGGHPVAGGRLSRSDANSAGEYLVLEAEDHLAYIFPMPGTDVDLATDAASELLIAADPD